MKLHRCNPLSLLFCFCIASEYLLSLAGAVGCIRECESSFDACCACHGCASIRYRRGGRYPGAVMRGPYLVDTGLQKRIWTGRSRGGEQHAGKYQMIPGIGFLRSGADKRVSAISGIPRVQVEKLEFDAPEEYLKIGVGGAKRAGPSLADLPGLRWSARKRDWWTGTGWSGDLGDDAELVATASALNRFTGKRAVPVLGLGKFRFRRDVPDSPYGYFEGDFLNSLSGIGKRETIAVSPLNMGEQKFLGRRLHTTPRDIRGQLGKLQKKNRVPAVNLQRYGRGGARSSLIGDVPADLFSNKRGQLHDMQVLMRHRIKRALSAESVAADVKDINSKKLFSKRLFTKKNVGGAHTDGGSEGTDAKRGGRLSGIYYDHGNTVSRPRGLLRKRFAMHNFYADVMEARHQRNALSGHINVKPKEYRTSDYGNEGHQQTPSHQDKRSHLHTQILSWKPMTKRFSNFMRSRDVGRDRRGSMRWRTLYQPLRGDIPAKRFHFMQDHINRMPQSEDGSAIHFDGSAKKRFNFMRHRRGGIRWRTHKRPSERGLHGPDDKRFDFNLALQRHARSFASGDIANFDTSHFADSDEAINKRFYIGNVFSRPTRPGNALAVGGHKEASSATVSPVAGMAKPLRSEIKSEIPEMEGIGMQVPRRQNPSMGRNPKQRASDRTRRGGALALAQHHVRIGFPNSNSPSSMNAISEGFKRHSRVVTGLQHPDISFADVGNEMLTPAKRFLPPSLDRHIHSGLMSLMGRPNIYKKSTVSARSTLPALRGVLRHETSSMMGHRPTAETGYSDERVKSIAEHRIASGDNLMDMAETDDVIRGRGHRPGAGPVLSEHPAAFSGIAGQEDGSDIAIRKPSFIIRETGGFLAPSETNERIKINKVITVPLPAPMDPISDVEQTHQEQVDPMTVHDINRPLDQGLEPDQSYVRMPTEDRGSVETDSRHRIQPFGAGANMDFLATTGYLG